MGWWAGCSRAGRRSGLRAAGEGTPESRGRSQLGPVDLGGTRAVAARSDTACQHSPSCTLRGDRRGGDSCRGLVHNTVGSGAPRGSRWLGCSSPGAVQTLQCPHPATKQSLPSCPASCGPPCATRVHFLARNGRGELHQLTVMAGREEPARQRSHRSARCSRVQRGPRAPNCCFPPRGAVAAAGRWALHGGTAAREPQPPSTSRRAVLGEEAKTGTLLFHVAAFRRASPRRVPVGQRLVRTAGAAEAQGFQLEDAFRGRRPLQ